VPQNIAKMTQILPIRFQEHLQVRRICLSLWGGRNCRRDVKAVRILSTLARDFIAFANNESLGHQFAEIVTFPGRDLPAGMTQFPARHSRWLDRIYLTLYLCIFLAQINQLLNF
jgi:hypothetical protein